MTRRPPRATRTYPLLRYSTLVRLVLEMAFVRAKTWMGAGPAAVVAGDYDNTHALGVAMYTDYVFAVQVGGVILLVGRIAAIALTLRKRHDVKRNRPSEQIKVQETGRAPCR